MNGQGGAARPAREAGGPPPQLPVIPYKEGNVCLESGCSACCRGTEMLLTEADVARIRAMRPGLDFLFTADDGFLQLRTRSEPTEPCVFLAADGRCSIHAVRPEGCRLYPAVWAEDLRTAELDKDYCPHTEGFLLPRSTNDAVARLAQRLQDERKRRISSKK